MAESGGRYVETTATVSSTSLVSIERNKYSVPCALANQKVSVRLYPERIEVHDDTGKVTHHCHIVETGNESFRFRQSSQTAKARIKSREQAKRGKAVQSEEETEPF